jgi:undecaprenyl diphosphate synthase
LEFAPEPDLLIRTGGEVRISNFVIWDLVYTELYFTDVLWPDFDANHFYEALSHYSDRDRRFGRAAVDQDALSENIVDS